MPVPQSHAESGSDRVFFNTLNQVIVDDAIKAIHCQSNCVHLTLGQIG